MKELPERRRTFAWAGWQEGPARFRGLCEPLSSRESLFMRAQPSLDLKTLMICGASARSYVSREIAALQ